jgi:probable addiction module antidote protein
MKAKTKKIKVRPFDAADYIETPKDVALFLEAAFEGAFEDDNPSLIAAALGDIARSKGMAAIAEETGLNRETLYRALSADGNPTLETMQGVLKALGVRLAVVPVHSRVAA